MSKTSGKNMEKGLFDSPDTKMQLEKLSQSLKNGQKEMLEKAIKNKSEKEITKILDELNKSPMKNDESVKKLSERVYRTEGMRQKNDVKASLDKKPTWWSRATDFVKGAWSRWYIRYPLIAAAVYFAFPALMNMFQGAHAIAVEGGNAILNNAGAQGGLLFQEMNLAVPNTLNLAGPTAVDPLQGM